MQVCLLRFRWRAFDCPS